MDGDGADLEDEFGIYDVPPALKIQLEVRLYIYIKVKSKKHRVLSQYFDGLCLSQVNQNM